MNQDTLDKIRAKAPRLADILEDDRKRKSLGYMILMFVALIALLFLMTLNGNKTSQVREEGVSVTPDMAAGEDQEVSEKSNIRMFDATKDLFKRNTKSEFDNLSEVDDIGDLSGGGYSENSNTNRSGGVNDYDENRRLQDQLKQTTRQLDATLSEPSAPRNASISTSGGSSSARQSSDAQAIATARQNELLLANGFDPETYHKEGKLVPIAEAQAARDAANAPEEERLDISAMTTPVRKTDAISSLDDAPGGIGGLSSLDNESAYVNQDANHPFKVMFIRDEKLSSGQRVTLRLLEDMMIGNVLVPKNTHLMAICNVSERMTLSISSIEMNGRIYSVNFEAYDTDGGKGIYCAQSSATKAAKEAGNQATMLGRNYIGGIAGVAAGTIVNAGAMIAQSAKGKVTVTTTSGYTFYIMQTKR